MTNQQVDIKQLLDPRQTYKLHDSYHGMRGAVKITLRNVETGEEDVTHILNVECYPGKVSIARRLGNKESGYGYIGYCATGTGVSTPTSSDTLLVTELFRKLISAVELNSNQVTFTTYFATAESNGNLTELGLFGDDSAAGGINTGSLYAHTTISKTKTVSDTLTIEWTITVN